MNKKFKFLTVLLALVMTLGAFAPFSARAEEAKETTNSVTLHKLIMTKEELKDWKSEDIETKGYNGTQDMNALKALLASGHTAHEVAGVYFAFKYNDGTNSGKYVTIKEEQGKDPVYGAVESLDATAKQLGEGFKLLAGNTEANGIKFTTKGLKGKFLIEEIHEKSTYKNDDGSVITDNKAVPVDITLPLVNNDGVVTDAHVYPKNTEDKPKIDKNFDENSGLKKGDKNETPVEDGAKYENYEMAKDTANVEIGQEVKYQVKTEIPAKSHLGEAHWDDRMTEGLTFKKGSLKIKVNNDELLPADYELVEEDNGFDLKLTKSGLEKINGKEAAVTVELKYIATVNEKAKVDIPDSNDVTFHYGHKKGHGNTPIPTKPKENGELEVEKTWADGVPKAGEWATFTLKNAKTGEEIGTVKFETSASGTTTTYTANQGYKPIGNEKNLQGPSTKTDSNNVWTFKFTGLDKDLEYKVEEDNNMGETAKFTKGIDGQIKIENKKDDNPKPLNPTEPKVVTGGKKFVKTNQDGNERLAGAEFYVKNAEGKYLVAAKKDAEAVKKAKDALDKAVKTYNALDADKQTDDEKAKVTAAQEAYNKAFKENAIKYTWGEKDDANVVVLTSDGQGRFEITGLAYGTYYLEEKTPPAGYAKRNDTPEFKVAKGSYTNEEEGKIDYKKIDYNEKSGKNDAQQITNKKVSIPQTGGIGTVIFTVVGVMLMVGAAFALKRRKEDELEGLA